LNGNTRSVVVRDQSVTSGVIIREKADRDNHHHVGAPMPGKVFKIIVKPGSEVKAGDVLMVTEAMKMETNIKAKSDGLVMEVKFKEGDKVEKDDLVIVMG
jgi:pyruvate carboxylase